MFFGCHGNELNDKDIWKTAYRVSIYRSMHETSATPIELYISRRFFIKTNLITLEVHSKYSRWSDKHFFKVFIKGWRALQSLYYMKGWVFLDFMFS
jgi:hypothetical protein